ncbi:ribose-phosphate pyrophosphokinase-like domain-containing protein [Streptomyces sp. CB02923]|uniref:ribose-phosphate pyrophosphokinase-like domain-containing protein n=1 Tax=Streptomyces sp. CB02923 TaxID=1718985 RepID=UPI003FD606A2
MAGFREGFITDVPGQAPFAEAALQEAGRHVRSHHGFEGRFWDSELGVGLPKDPSGRTVLPCQPATGTHTPADAPLMSLAAPARSYREHGAGRTAAVLPHPTYARHDRHVPGRHRPLTAGLPADPAMTAGPDDAVTTASGARDPPGRRCARSGTRPAFLPVHEPHLDLLRPLTGRETAPAAPDRAAPTRPPCPRRRRTGPCRRPANSGPARSRRTSRCARRTAPVTCRMPWPPA